MAAGAAPAGAAPPRVVSINLCTDQLAMMLAAPGQLLSVSWLAADPMSSSMVAEAQALPLNRGRAEEIWLLRPDLVLAGEWTTPATVAMLDRLGVAVARFGVVTRLDDVAPALRRMGAALGAEARAEAEAAAFEAGLARLRAQAPRAGTAAIYDPSGYAAGRGTLAADILAAAGWRNAAPEGGRVALEEMVLARPDILISPPAYRGRSRAEDVPAHPALRAVAERRRSTPDWVCGTPHVLRAIAALGR